VRRRFLRRILARAGFRAKRPLIGLDIGSSGAKAVQLTPAGESYRVAAFATEPVPPGAVVDGALIDGPAVSATLRRLFEHTAFTPAGIAAAVPTLAAIVKRITLPVMSARELHEAIAWEAEQQIPFPLADVQWHYEPVTHASSAARTVDVLLVAARRDTITALAGVIADAGLRTAVIDVCVLALERAYRVNSAAHTGSAVALVDIGASATTVSIVVDGHLALVRHVPLGGRAYTEALQRALKVSFDAAEDLKKNHDASPDRHALEAAQRPTTDVLLDDLRKTFDFFRSTTGAERIGGLVVSGGGSLLPGLTYMLGQRLNMPAEPLNPFRSLIGPRADPDSPRSVDPRILAAAVGLALHRGDAR
jgi:type IV pilus assembly protein PilM